jgi:uncharacterized OB-fold protein
LSGREATGTALTPVARDEDTSDFFDATRQGTLLLGRRRSTGEYVEPARVAAWPGDGDLEYAPAGGGGRVVSWSVVHKRVGAGGESARIVVGIVELDEGPWWWCRLDGVDPDGDLTDLRVRAEFVRSGPEPDHEVVPVFRPA